MTSPLLRLSEVAEMCGISERTARRRAQAGLEIVPGVPAFTIGLGQGQYRVLRVHVSAFLRGETVGAAAS